MTRDINRFHDPHMDPHNGVGHYSEPYLEFRNAEAFEYAKGKR